MSDTPTPPEERWRIPTYILRELLALRTAKDDAEVTTPANDLRVMLTAHLKNLDPIELYNELDDFCELISADDEFLVEELTNTLSLGPTSKEMDELRLGPAHG